MNVQGEHCVVKMQEGSLDVTCPKGRLCIITVTSDDGKYWDTVVISNPGRFARETMQSVEGLAAALWSGLPESNTFSLAQQGWTALLGRQHG